MPITALPSPWGIGTMGRAARGFVDFLRKSGQSCWQVLPIGPTSFGDSPYQSFSSFAGNPYLIDLDDLCADGLLDPWDYQSLSWGSDPARVDYGLLYRQRFDVLRKAVDRLWRREGQALARFLHEERDWVYDYALFMALKDHYHGAPWSQWPEALRRRESAAMKAASAGLSRETAFWQGVQFLFFRQWQALKDYAARQGIAILGDLPIYVAEDSADVWANPSLFQMDETLRPTEVAGCPPDAFTADGQLWGNPLFRWDEMEKTGYRWWMQRIAHQFRFYDMLRIDHFRGFDSYYAIPFGDENARRGRWRPGPGIGFFRELERQLGPRPIIAEDLGFLTPSVRQLLAETGYPGMKVLEFAFDSRDGGGREYQPHNYPKNCVAYVGTHDNDTVQGWCKTADPGDVALALEYVHADPWEGVHWSMMRAIWMSGADLAIVQMQDLLGLGSEARINEPSTVGHNWQWRALPGFDSPALAQRLHRQMELYERLPQAEEEPEGDAEPDSEAPAAAETEVEVQDTKVHGPQAEGGKVL